MRRGVRGLARSAAQQSAMASDLRALGNLLARCSAQRKAENAARRRAAANLGGSPTRSTAAQTNDASVAGQVGGGTSGALPSAVKRRATPTRTLGFVTPGGASAQHRQSRAAGSGGAGLGLHAGFHAAVNEAERAAERAAAGDRHGWRRRGWHLAGGGGRRGRRGRRRKAASKVTRRRRRLRRVSIESSQRRRQRRRRRRWR